MWPSHIWPITTNRQYLDHHNRLSQFLSYTRRQSKRQSGRIYDANTQDTIRISYHVGSHRIYVYVCMKKLYCSFHSFYIRKPSIFSNTKWNNVFEQYCIRWREKNNKERDQNLKRSFAAHKEQEASVP